MIARKAPAIEGEYAVRPFGDFVTKDEANARVIEVGGRAVLPGSSIGRAAIEEIDQRFVEDLTEARLETSELQQLRQNRAIGDMREAQLSRHGRGVVYEIAELIA